MEVKVRQRVRRSGVRGGQEVSYVFGLGVRGEGVRGLGM